MSASQPEQLALCFNKEEHVREFFEKTLAGKSVELKITANTTSMVSVRKKTSSSISVRLQRMFLDAGADVLAELVQYIKGEKRETPLIREFIKQNIGKAESKKPPRKTRAHTRGKYHDLLPVYRELNGRYFNNSVCCDITWGARTRLCRKAVRKRTLGSYSARTNTRRISPVLDSGKCPAFFVEFVVYHEMLHAHMGPEKKGRRRVVHSREFRRRERLFRDYEKAAGWEKKTFSPAR